VDAPQKLAFIVQSNRLQGLIWQALLKSQRVAVILEPGSADLAECINQIAMAGLTLPDVIILDAEASELNPYEFCRWCRDAFPKMPIFLTRFRNLEISSTERRWATQQGATDFLEGFQRDNLMSSAADNMRCILSALEHPFLDEKALLTVLLNIRRQLRAAQPALGAPSGAVPRANGHNPAVSEPMKQLESANGKASSPSEAPSLGPDRAKHDVLNDISWVTSGTAPLEGDRANSNGKASPKSLFTPPPTVATSTLPKPREADRLASGKAVRRYRGTVY